MAYKMASSQMSMFDFVLPYGGTLNEKNRWVRLARWIDWDRLEAEYSRHFGTTGKNAMPFRLAFGALVVHDALGISDRETVRLIAESPYMQYFVGAAGFSGQLPCAPATLAKFRRRIDPAEVEVAVQQFKKYSKEK
ncbi:MAG: transposase [Faecalibacterium sp.]|nr:transposase [Faecalibacterium sp.]